MNPRIKRNSVWARLLHGLHFISCFILFLSGLAWYFPALAGFLGGHLQIATLHRIAAFFFIGVPIVVIFIKPQGLAEFSGEFFNWHREDLGWLFKMHSYLLNYEQANMPKVKGKHNAGQKFTGSIMIATSIILALTGVIRVFYIPYLSRTALFTLSSIHQLAMLILGAILIGHIYLGLGLFKPYRGMRRAMFGDGTLSPEFAKKHWPTWLKGKEQTVTEQLTPTSKTEIQVD